jgi:hypothetical protein
MEAAAAGFECSGVSARESREKMSSDCGRKDPRFAELELN